MIELFIDKLVARVAQRWSIALPRRGSRVRIPSRASNMTSENLIKSRVLRFFRYLQFEYP